MTTRTVPTPEELQAELRRRAYLADRGLAVALHLGLALEKPLLLEGESGVGKTEAARALADVLDARFIRLQCYEGIDANQALYEWNYAYQLLHIRALGDRQQEHASARELFSPEFLVERPLLAAVRAGRGAVLLIDEVDRADDEFEAFLLEVLQDFSVTIPELGTVQAPEPPVVVLTSNRTRELHDALRRRCIYHWIDYPSPEREAEIVLVRAPDVDEALARRVSLVVGQLRELGLMKPPGIAEAIDWARALGTLGVDGLEPAAALDTLGAIVKAQDDRERVREAIPRLLADEG